MHFDIWCERVSQLGGIDVDLNGSRAVTGDPPVVCRLVTALASEPDNQIGCFRKLVGRCRALCSYDADSQVV